MTKPFSQACENNKNHILTALQPALQNAASVLEIGSGTGQHSVFFAKKLPHLQWYTSDREVNHQGIKLWHDEVQLANLHPPLLLDLNYSWPVNKVDAVYTANTFHIVSWELITRFFAGVNQHLNQQGVVCVYGPFKYKGGVYQPQ
jgi:cyclopropane fatty-acyl-phospholipid synthase-like methyltransferase